MLAKQAMHGRVELSSDNVIYSTSSSRFLAAFSALLCAMAAVQAITVRGESQTYDESNQLLSGYSYLATGHFTVALEQPPLVKLLCAIPVALLRPDPPPSHIALENPWPAGREFLYHNRTPADSMLMAGRSSAIAISVLLGVAIAVWAGWRFGPRVALLAVLLYALDPNFLANGRYIKNDVAAALAIFVTAMIWGAYLARPCRKLLLLSGVALGLALTTKFSALILLPVMLILYAIRRWQERRGFGIAACARLFGGVGLIAFLVIVAVYGFEVRPLGESGIFRRLWPTASWAAGLPIPALGYWRGLADMGLKQTETGLASAYLLGRTSRFGWWYMSPVAFAVKTPLADLALVALAAAIAGRRLWRASLRAVDFKWFQLAVPPAVYAAVSLLSHFNAGLRHLLPLYPFLFVFVAAVLLAQPVPRWRWMAVLAGAVLLLVESAAIHPHYLAFFNALAGGPIGGQRILVDSNLDWGQDVKNLKAYLDARRIPEVSIRYFGMAELEYYGIRHRELPPVPGPDAAQNLDCVAAISVTSLALERSRYAGLTALSPDARIGYSINVYDLRKRRPAGGRQAPAIHP